MQLMRHESIETPMRFYVGRNAQSAADRLWAAHKSAANGHTSGHTGDSSQVTSQTEDNANQSAD